MILELSKQEAELILDALGSSISAYHFLEKLARPPISAKIKYDIELNLKTRIDEAILNG